MANRLGPCFEKKNMRGARGGRCSGSLPFFCTTLFVRDKLSPMGRLRRLLGSKLFHGMPDAFKRFFFQHNFFFSFPLFRMQHVILCPGVF